ncbi:MAG: GNAT family N-acetyltransferase, partial [Actinomycetota bacterium]|nr:GNAT family N-acetyltransferase [Actinomycetota bacterium]
MADELDMRGFLLAERLWCEEEWPRLLNARPLRRATSSLLRLSGRTFEEWLASVSPKFRREMQRRERNLVRDHGLTFRLVTGEAERESALAALIRLHDARWRNTSTTFGAANTRFYDAFTRMAAERGWLRLWLAEVDGRPIAARLGFYFAGRAWAYQSGRDPAWDKSGVGIVLLVHTLREA